MRNIWTIASREYKQFFISPVAYAVAFLFLVVLGWIFFSNMLTAITYAAYQSYAPTVQIVISPMVTLFLFFLPAITMGALAQEQRMGTMELLLTAPVKDWELVVGKWLGCFMFVLTLLAVTWVFPIALNAMVEPGIDQGHAGLIGDDEEDAQAFFAEGARFIALHGQTANGLFTGKDGDKDGRARGVFIVVARARGEVLHLSLEIVDEQGLAVATQPTHDAIVGAADKAGAGQALTVAHPDLDDKVVPIEQAQVKAGGVHQAGCMLEDQLTQLVFVHARLHDGLTGLGQGAQFVEMERRPSHRRQSIAVDRWHVGHVLGVLGRRNRYHLAFDHRQVVAKLRIEAVFDDIHELAHEVDTQATDRCVSPPA